MSDQLVNITRLE